MKLYKNLWAGHPSYFLEILRSNFFRKGIGFWFGEAGEDGEVFVDYNAEYYNFSFKEHPERFPLVGEISDKEFFNCILSAAQRPKDAKAEGAE